MRYLLIAIAFLAGSAGFAAEPLPSWNDGTAKAAILDFIAAATDESSGGFIPDEDRVAVFDNDGTLWTEQPVYFQLFYALDRAGRLADADPDWASSPALQAAAAGDIGGVMAGGEEGLVEVITATHSGLSVEDFTADVQDWIGRAAHPQTGRPFDRMIFQPMVELLGELRANGFDTYIVSGGGVDFMRAFAEEAYGIPPENTIGSMGEARFEMVDGVPTVLKEPAIAFIDDGGGKPVGISRHIGRRPVFVAGNSDGDLAMAQWSMAGEGPRFAMFVHHTDPEREYSYDRESPVGHFDLALDEASEKGWTIVDMQRDWSVIWPE